MKIPKWGMAVAVPLVVLTMLLVPVAAATTYPCLFHGTATVDGEPVLAGTEISAWVESVKINSTLTGGPGGNEYALSVELTLEQSHEVSFKIGTLWADETYTWIQYGSVLANLTATTPDTTPPTVVSTSPEDGATEVPVDTLVTATFSEPINPATIVFTLDTVSGSVSYSDTTATFTPDANLDYSTTYTASIQASDLAGNPMAEPYTWSFTTGEDITPPEVIRTSPRDGATGVAIDAVVTATFSEDIQEGDNFSGIAISEATGVSATIDGAILTIAHDDFDYDTTYEVTIPAGAVNDLAEPANALAEPYTWSFTTEAKLPPEEVEVEEEEVAPPKPEVGPRLSVYGLRVSPDEVSPNQPVTVSIKVSNAGDRGGSKTLNLLINGELEQSAQVGVPGHSAKSVSFTVYRATAGQYSVSIDGITGWLTVLQPVAPSAPVEAGLGTGGLIAIVVMAIILIGGLTFAFLYTRRSA